MKIDPLLLGRLVMRFLPTIRKIGAALSKHSDGGKAITPEERDGIVAELVAIAEDELS
jgi:hypothetical protein